MTSKQQKIADFDPNQPGAADASIFGLPFDADESDLIVIAVPWEVTVSYGDGASLGPNAILDASYQMDLYNQAYPELWKLGIYVDEALASDWMVQNSALKAKAQTIIDVLESGGSVSDDSELMDSLDEINSACALLNKNIEERVLYWKKRGKKVALLGGDHSTPLGYYKALAEDNDSFGILHLDAHMDLREAYEGFTYSHASIMYNALQLPQIQKIVQVGIRDFCEQEVSVVRSSEGKVKVFTDQQLKENFFNGLSWKEQCEQIIHALPDRVTVSCDIDSLYQWYCPNTGTPVPGGLSFEQVMFLIGELAKSNKTIIGFDLVEVSPGENSWDGNVGARLLFNLCGAFAKSQGMNVGTPLAF